MKKQVKYKVETDVSATQTLGTYFTIYQWISKEAKDVRDAVDKTLKAWCKQKGFTKEGNFIHGCFPHLGGSAGKTAVKRTEAEVKKIIREIIKHAGYTPKMRK